MYDTHMIVILSISVHPVYLSPILFSPYPGKNEFWKKTLEKILLSNIVNHREGRGLYYFSTFMHCVLHIAVLYEYLLRNNLGKGTKVFTSLFLLSSLNLKSFFFMEAAVCAVSPSHLSLLTARHTIQATNWKSQALESIYHH